MNEAIRSPYAYLVRVSLDVLGHELSGDGGQTAAIFCMFWYDLFGIAGHSDEGLKKWPCRI